ncbi:MAG TPA: sulfite exporter TauE/SafE family protein [Burkholderiales bacterium]|nr:sulfite exporter TauE/SafE family protein [Burkholderiales bacterium]
MPADLPLWFSGLVLAIAIVSGATASVVGFGIGSLLTPVFALRFGMDAAIAAVALPHFAGSLLRGWRLRRSVDRSVLLRFGVLSAAGGLAGALLYSRLAPLALTRTLGALLLLTATAGLSGWSQRWKPTGAFVWLLGGLSGFFGGVVGNQGGLRAAALSAFGLAPAAFVATSTVIGVIVDVVRTPLYLLDAGPQLSEHWAITGFAIAGVLAGTLAGERLLFGLSRERFRLLVSLAIGCLGLWFLFAAG